MPPRYAYWTILVDNQPTAFRSGSQEELLPTFKRLKAKNDTAVMMWFQNGKLWPSRVDAQEAMYARGEMGRRGDERQAGSGGGYRDRERKPFGKRPERRERSAWTPRGEPSTPPAERNADNKLDWKPKGEFVPAPKRADRDEWKPKASFDREPRSEWKPKPRGDKPDWSAKPGRAEKPEWKPKSFDREERPRSFKRPDFKSSGDDSRTAKPEWKPKGSFEREPRADWKSKPRSEKPEWKPKGSSFAKATADKSFDRERKPDWKPKDRPGGFSGSRSAKPDWKPKGSSFAKATADKSFDRGSKPGWKPNRDSGGRFSAPDHERSPRTEKLEWKPKGEGSSRSPIPDPRSPVPGSPEKRKWLPKEEYKKSMGIEAKRDSKWRPGGDHKDPRQKYKDAKKAKWTRFKENIRARSGGRGKKPS